MSDLHRRLRHDLTAALRMRDRDAIRVLRTVLSAVANAEAQPDLDETPVSLRSGGAFAGSVEGLAVTEVGRRELDEEQVRAVVRAELDDRLAVAEDLAAKGAVEAAGVLRAEAGFLGRYLGSV